MKSTYSGYNCAYISVSVGDKLAEIFQKENGNFAAMELKVKQIVREQEENEIKGGWLTEIGMKSKGWTE